MKNKIINIIKLLLCLICFFTIGTIFSFMFKLLGISIDDISNKGMVYYQIVLSIIITLVSYIVYKDKLKDDYIKFKKNIGFNIKTIFKLFIIFMIVKYIVSFITILIITLLKYDMSLATSVNQDMIEDFVKVSPLLMVISTAFFAPFYEEVIFRLGFKKVLNKGIFFVLVSGILFGVLHVFPLEEGIPLLLGVIQSISYVTMGLFLAYSYNKYDNIFISIGIHFLNNFISILTMINML